MVRVTLCFAVLLAVFGNGLCLKCYQCTSAPNKYKCQETLNYTATEAANNLKECNQDIMQYNKQYLQSAIPPRMLDLLPSLGKFQCVKITNGLGEIARTCLPAESAALCQTFLGDKQLKACIACDKDGCNGSSAISASLPVALLALVLSYILYKQ